MYEMTKAILVVLILAGTACAGDAMNDAGAMSGGNDGKATALATFAGGCFWCMEPAFEKVDGVAEVLSGYTGGKEKNPTYEEVGSGKTGHCESVQVRYDPTKVGYRKLLDVYWHQINPTDGGGQFADRGSQYRPAIFVHDEVQRRLALVSREEIAESGRFMDALAVEIVPAGPFYPAEDYHQDFYKKDPERYHSYRKGSGREGYLARVWGKNGSDPMAKKWTKPSDAELKKRLTPMQYDVTQEDGTEPPFKNEFWDNHRAGIYVDIVSGEPLFISLDKFDSGTGWPSFTRPLEPGNVVEKTDLRLGYARSEVRSRKADSHLGHVFRDGPKPTGLRFCIDSAALRFVPEADLAKEGYGAYAVLFGKGMMKKEN